MVQGLTWFLIKVMFFQHEFMLFHIIISFSQLGLNPILTIHFAKIYLHFFTFTLKWCFLFNLFILDWKIILECLIHYLSTKSWSQKLKNQGLKPYEMNNTSNPSQNNDNCTNYVKNIHWHNIKLPHLFNKHYLIILLSKTLPSIKQ
jgi:hypothetical protein